MPVHKGGKKNAKLGRNEKKCKRYATNLRRETNKRRKLIKHLRWQPNDTVAQTSLQNIFKEKH